MSRIKAGLELAEEIKQEEQLAEIQEEPTEETVEEFQEESIEETLSAIDESFGDSVKDMWGKFWGKDERGGDAGKYFGHLAQKYETKSPVISAYFSIMAGRTPSNIEDPEAFKNKVEKNPAYKMHIDAELKNARLNELNELKEPDYSDDDTEEYLKKLTPKKVKKDYEKTLPKGHTSLAKKYKLESVGDEDDGNIYMFRVLCTLKDYGHPMVSKRGEDIMKHIKVEAATKRLALVKAKSFYKKKGYEVLDCEVVGITALDGEPVKEAVENPKDKVTLDVPLLIRLLEYAREDAKTDMDLHDLTEKLVALGSESGKTLSMQDYDQLVPSHDVEASEPAMEAKNPAMARAKSVAKMEKNAPGFKRAMAKDKDKE